MTTVAVCSEEDFDEKHTVLATMEATPDRNATILRTTAEQGIAMPVQSVWLMLLLADTQHVGSNVPRFTKSLLAGTAKAMGLMEIDPAASAIKLERLSVRSPGIFELRVDETVICDSLRLRVTDAEGTSKTWRIRFEDDEDTKSI